MLDAPSLSLSLLLLLLLLLQVAIAAGLGALNVVGVGVLSNLLVDPQARYVLVVQGLGWIASAMPC